MPEGDKRYLPPNRKMPRIASARSPVLASVINELAEAIEKFPESRAIKVGKGLLMDEHKGNTIIRMGTPPSPIEKWYPFKLYQQDAVDKPLGVSVFYGTISGTVPVIKGIQGANALGTPINVSMNDDKTEEQIAEASLITGQPWVEAGEGGDGEYQIWIEYTHMDPCQGDDGIGEVAYVGDADHPNEVIIGARPIPPPSDLDADEKPAPPNPNRGAPPGYPTTKNFADANVMPLSHAFTGYVEIGRVTVKEDRITKIVNSLTHSLIHTSCGVRHYFWGV